MLTPAHAALAKEFERLTAQMWPGALVIPTMSTGAARRMPQLSARP